jgi:hypothetical protein
MAERLAALVRRDHLDAFVADVQRTQSPATAKARGESRP